MCFYIKQPHLFLLCIFLRELQDIQDFLVKTGDQETQETLVLQETVDPAAPKEYLEPQDAEVLFYTDEIFI